MGTITENDVRAELSYAYLHAVASHARLTCQNADRTVDGLGIDAEIRGQERFADDSILEDFLIDVQLKATSQKPALHGGKYSFPLEIAQYDKLRTEKTDTTKLLVLFFLPEKQDDWLSHTEDGLVCRRCAYWVSLFGAKKSDNKGSQTIYVPKSQIFCPESLREIMTRVSRRERIRYAD